MKLPQAGLDPISARDFTSYFFTRKTGGANKAIRSSTPEYLAVDVFQNESITSTTSLESGRILSIYNGASLSCDLDGFINSGTMSILKTGTLSIPVSLVNQGDLIVENGGTLSIPGVVQNVGTITIKAGGTLSLIGSIVNQGSIILEPGAILAFEENTVVVSLEQAADPSLAFPYGKVTYSLDLYAWLEDVFSSELEETGCSLGAKSQVADDYTLALYRHVTAKSRAEFDALLPPIVLTGYTRTATTDIKTPAVPWVTFGRFDKVMYQVSLSDVISDDHSIGPDKGVISSRIVQVPFLRTIQGQLATDFPGFTYSSNVVVSGSSMTETAYKARRVRSNESVLVTYDPIKYSVRYVLDGGSGASMAQYTTDQGLSLLTPSVPSGWKFLGWYLDSNLTTSPISAIQKWTIGDVVLYAKYSYTVTYLNAGLLVSLDTYTTDTGLTLAPMSVPGKLFKGWFSDPNLQVPATVPPGTKGNITVYASFSVIVYTVTYVLNGGTGPTTGFYTVDTGLITLPTPTSWLLRKFTGWYDEYNNRVISIPAGSIGDRTLYAQYIIG